MSNTAQPIKQQVENSVCDGPKPHQHTGVLYLIPTKAKAYCPEHYQLAIKKEFKK